MIAKDDPAHHEQRALVARRFTPKAVQRLEPVIAEVIDDLVDGFVDRGEFEVVDDLAAPFPARLTAHLLGFGEERVAGGALVVGAADAHRRHPRRRGAA